MDTAYGAVYAAASSINLLKNLAAAWCARGRRARAVRAEASCSRQKRMRTVHADAYAARIAAQYISSYNGGYLAAPLCWERAARAQHRRGLGHGDVCAGENL